MHFTCKHADIKNTTKTYVLMHEHVQHAYYMDAYLSALADGYIDTRIG